MLRRRAGAVAAASGLLPGTPMPRSAAKAGRLAARPMTPSPSTA
jgi:hypothetical protein